MRMKSAFAVLGALCIAASAAMGAATVNWSFLAASGVLVDATTPAGDPLNAGDPAAAGDGTVLQLLAWVGGDAWGTKLADIPWGTTDPVDPNYVLLASATVGDGMETFNPTLAPGRFSVASGVDSANVDAQMVIRFFDESMVFYNEVSSPDWTVPADLTATSIDVSSATAMDLASELGNPHGAPGKQGDNYATALTVPEPSMILLLGAGLGALWRRVRR